MSNLIINWWRDRQFFTAIKKGNYHLAQQLIEKTQEAGSKLSLLQKIFRDKLQFEQSSNEYQREVLVLRDQVSQALQTIEELSNNKYQLEQLVKDLSNQIQHKQHEFVSIQQQLDIRGQELQALHEQLRQKKQEIIVSEQELEARGRHIEELRKQRNEVLTQAQIIEQLLEQKQQEFINLDQNKTQTDNLVIKLQETLTQKQQKLERVEKEQSQLLKQKDIKPLLLQPSLDVIEFISNVFKLVELDQNKLKCTGIDERIFNDFEASLAKYLEEEFVKLPKERVLPAVIDAFKDIKNLKNKQDPLYNFELTPHVYFLNYFLDNVYCAYLAWFLVYKSGLLPTNLNILDIAAGPGTVAYGIALFLRSSSSILQMPQTHISYYSLEKQASFQYRGLQFWRQYIEPQQSATNAYFRFDTTDIFAYDGKSKKLPQAFFDFVVISHCFFAEKEQRNKSYEVYKKIFAESLTPKGYVLIIVQGTKLFRAYNIRQSEIISQEQSVIRKLVEELDLRLEWYKYITSTGTREYIKDFSKFARENLPAQKFISPLKRKYLEVNFESRYNIDDYVILARR